MLESSPFECYNVHIKRMYRQISQRVRTRMADTLESVKRRTDGKLRGSNSAESPANFQNRTIGDKLKEGGNYLVDRGRKTTLRILKSQVNGESVFGGMRELAGNLFDSFQHDTLQTFCRLLKEVLSERWKVSVEEE